MASFLERLRQRIGWLDTGWTVLGWLGWKSAVVSLALAIASAAGSLMQSVPWSIALSAAFCVLVGAFYLTLLPRFIQATQQLRPADRPSVEIWGHVQQFQLFEAACLLADRQPSLHTLRNDGDVWGIYQMLDHALGVNEISRVVPRKPPGVVVAARGAPNAVSEYTQITRVALQAFARKRGMHRAFLVDPIATTSD